MSAAEFTLLAHDYGMMVDVTCTSDTGCYPNQADLREALNKLMFALSNWEHVDITIKTVEEE